MKEKKEKFNETESFDERNGREAEPRAENKNIPKHL